MYQSLIFWPFLFPELSAALTKRIAALGTRRFSDRMSRIQNTREVVKKKTVCIELCWVRYYFKPSLGHKAYEVWLTGSDLRIERSSQWMELPYSRMTKINCHQMIKTLSSFEIILWSLRPSFSDEGTALSERVRKPREQLIDVHENSGSNRLKKTFRGRVLVVTAVTVTEKLIIGVNKREYSE